MIHKFGLNSRKESPKKSETFSILIIFMLRAWIWTIELNLVFKKNNCFKIHHLWTVTLLLRKQFLEFTNKRSSSK